jgi:diguanylate cyclase (GGDEF)-like protein
MSLAVMYLDRDGFKEVNDGYGHSTGDALLKLVGERLLSVVRGYDAVARLGGDEFALLIEDIGEERVARIHQPDTRQRLLPGGRRVDICERADQTSSAVTRIPGRRRQ